MTRRPTRRASRFLAGGLAFTLSIVSSAVCFAGILQMEERQQHASCPMGMGHESDSPETAKLDCCIGQSPQFAGITQGTVAPPVAAAVVLGVVTAIPDSPVPAPPVLSAFDPDVSKPSSTPTYLLVSVFRV